MSAASPAGPPKDGAKFFAVIWAYRSTLPLRVWCFRDILHCKVTGSSTTWAKFIAYQSTSNVKTRRCVTSRGAKVDPIFFHCAANKIFKPVTTPAHKNKQKRFSDGFKISSASNFDTPYMYVLDLHYSSDWLHSCPCIYVCRCHINQADFGGERSKRGKTWARRRRFEISPCHADTS